MEYFSIILKQAKCFKLHDSVNAIRNEESFCLFVGSKSLIAEPPFLYAVGQDWVTAIGTLSYRAMEFKPGLVCLAKDILTGKFDPNELYGHYTIIYYINTTLTILFDESEFGAPYCAEGIISSSFLRCCAAATKLTPYVDAIFTEVYSGCFLNGKTTFHEVERVHQEKRMNLESVDVYFKPVIHQVYGQKLKSFKDAVEYQLSIFDNYFTRWRRQLSKVKIDIGLSSGYDSRLTLALLQKYHPGNFQVHTYWKAQEDFDTKIAKQLANIVGLPLIGIEIEDRNTLKHDQLIQLIESACTYYDGTFPTNHGWVRAFRTAEYRRKVLGTARFGMSGLSGEQYRNDFKLADRNYSKKAVAQLLLLDETNFMALDKCSFKKEGYNILFNELRTAQNYKSPLKSLSRVEIQKLYCKLWVSFGPGLRNKHENQLAFFISPFTERSLQRAAENLIPFLGNGGDFQVALIRSLNPKLAAVMSDYGHSLNAIPLKQKVSDLFSTWIGNVTKRKLTFRKRFVGDYCVSYGPHKLLIKEKLEYLAAYNFPFPTQSQYFGNATNDRLVALSTLLNKFESKISR